ncbi:hypothetical protein EV356DRAFT_507694 [Viridothelium virens]|uniref:Uncharacterized protein n=1 Tax=Viridothelium virens TaxID=1048519 RepID=A0A6A6GZP9_VIRVR|nr:hypothetical protein EV356DRAFT_507694 [Viridothelium virens]
MAGRPLTLVEAPLEGSFDTFAGAPPGGSLDVKLRPGLFRTFKRTDPEFEDCFGSFVCKSGPFSLWQTKGKLSNIWSTIAPRIIDILYERQVRLRQAHSSEGPSNPYFTLRCFLVGLNQRYATPHAAIVCGPQYSSFAKMARRLILQHDILRERHWGLLCLLTDIQMLSGERQQMPGLYTSLPPGRPSSSYPDERASRRRNSDFDLLRTE